MTYKIDVDDIVSIKYKSGENIPLISRDLQFNKKFKLKYAIVIVLKIGESITIERDEKLKLINNKIAVVATFKNESHIIKEWIEHYLQEGVDYFYLTNNNSTDNFMKQLKLYIDNNLVHLTNNNNDDNKNAQPTLHSVYGIDKIKYDSIYEWAILVDLDEFIYARQGTIKSYLSSLKKNIKQVVVPWKMFGSSELIEQPSSVISNFINRRAYPQVIETGCRTIARTIDIKNVNENCMFDITHGNIISSDGNPTNFSPLCQISEKILSKSKLHLNHYAFQSKNRFNKSQDNQNDEYFKNNDCNEYYDGELKNKKY